MCRRISSVCVICGIWLFNLHIERVEKGSHSSGLYKPAHSHTRHTALGKRDSPNFLVKTVNFRVLKPRPFSLVMLQLCLVETTNLTIKTFIQIIKEQRQNFHLSIFLQHENNSIFTGKKKKSISLSSNTVLLSCAGMNCLASQKHTPVSVYGTWSPSVGVTWVSSETGWAPCTYTSGTVRPASSVPSPPSRYPAAS